MLKVSKVNFGYQFRSILKNVSFNVERSQLLHLVGVNGSGKTTMMSILAGLLKESSGEIRLTDTELTEADRRRYIEYLPAEANGLYGKMDAIDNLKFWQNLRGLCVSKAALIEELALWKLDHPLIRENFPVEKFSTGMKRRLSLARVHLSKTPLWLLDEPLYGLDAKGIQQFQGILAEHLDQGGAAVIVSHDTAPLERFQPIQHTLTQVTKT